MSLSLDRLLFGLVVALALVPFNQVHLFRLGFITLGLYEVTIVSVMITATIIIALRGARRRFTGLFFSWVIVSAGFFVLTPVINGGDLRSAFRQIRPFLPFFAAVLLLVAPVKGNVTRSVEGVVVGTAIGGMAAIIIHLLFPEFLTTALSANEDAVAISVVHGRLCWSNAVMTFVALSYVVTRKKTDVVAQVCCMVCVFGTLLTLNRTLPPFMIAFYIVAHYSVSKRISRTFLSLAILSVMAAVLVFWLADDRYFHLFAKRFLGHGDLANIYERCVLYGRAVMYERYLEIIMETFPLGQGLGLPYVSTRMGSVYITDNSFLAFFLPFGVLGGFLFIWFIERIWGALDEKNLGPMESMDLVRVLRIMLAFLCLVSLNIDVFSRNNAVLILAFLVSSILGEKSKTSTSMATVRG